MKIIFRLIILLQVCAANAQHNYLLIGTYTKGKSEGIYVYDFNSGTGGASYKSKIKASNPSFLAVSPASNMCTPLLKMAMAVLAPTISAKKQANSVLLTSNLPAATALVL